MCPKMRGKVQAKLCLALLFCRSQVKWVHLTALNFGASSHAASSCPACARLSARWISGAVFGELENSTNLIPKANWHAERYIHAKVEGCLPRSTYRPFARPLLEKRSTPCARSEITGDIKALLGSGPKQISVSGASQACPKPPVCTRISCFLLHRNWWGSRSS